MEQAVKIIIAVIAIGIAITALQRIIVTGKDAFSQSANDQTLSILQDRCEYTCSMNTFDSQIAEIKVASGTLLYTEKDRICYSGSKTRCKLCSCNLTEGVILDLTIAEAKKAFETHNYKCSIVRDTNVTINCAG